MSENSDTTSETTSGTEHYADTNGRDIEVKQSESTSEAHSTSDVESDDDVNVLPGTGGPDDVGDVDVDPSEIDLPGFPEPSRGGHDAK